MAERYDVVVAGGGTAGCALAARLAEQGREVCLVEAGPDYGPYDARRWPADILDGRWLALDSHCWDRDDEGDRSQLRARILGGCSAHNACVMLRGAPQDYDEWGEGWSAGELDPYLDRAERAFATRATETDELSPWHRGFAEAAEDVIVHPVNLTREGVRWTAAFAYVDLVREKLTIAADTLVDRVLLDGTRAVGVATTNGEIRAETTVVTAGAYGSPGILLRSSIGPEMGLPVGENLCDHVGTGMAWEPTDELRRDWDGFVAERELSMAGVTLPLRSLACADDVCDLFLFPATDPDYEISGAVFAMKPRSRGRVSLTSPDPRAPLRIEHGFLAEEADVPILVEGFERLREFGRAAPIARYAARELRPGEDVDPEEHVRTTARGFFHPTGTCSLGKVVDERARVFGYDNLLVADASIMPTIPSVNTNLSVAAIAERIAETL